MDKRYDVFISYSSVDQKVTEGICGFLEARGIRCFVSYRDIPRGVDWADYITEAIDISRMMVVVFSKNFNNSRQTNREIAMAADKPMPILTYRITNDELTGSKKYYLNNLNWIDAFPNTEQYFGELYANVCKLLDVQSGNVPCGLRGSIFEQSCNIKNTPTMQSSIEIHIEVDADCEFFCFNEYIATLHVGDNFVTRLNPGTFKLTFKSVKYPDIYITQKYTITSGIYSDFMEIKLKKLIEVTERNKRERIRLEELEKQILNPVIQRKKYVFVDETGKIIFNTPWNWNAPGFHEGLAAVKGDNNKFGYIDKAGSLVIPYKWEDADFFYEGLAAVKDDEGKWGYIDKNGKLIISFKEWRRVWHFSDGLARVEEKNERSGFIDKTGKLVIPCQWKTEWSYHHNAMVQKNWWVFNNGLALVVDESKRYGFIDKVGKLIIPCQWKQAMPFKEDLALVKNESDLYGFVDQTGKIVINCQWKEAMSFNEDLALIKSANGLYGFIDKTGKIVSQCQWKSAWSFSEGLARVEDVRGKWGFIDKTGKTAIHFLWVDAKPFSEGLAGVKDASGKWGFIDKTGKLVLPYHWKDVWSFHGGLCRVLHNSLSSIDEHYIDSNGNLIW